MVDRSEGFTLIETLVALVIFASVFAALTSGLSGGSRGLRVARMDQQAVMLAKAKLTAAGFEVPLADGQYEKGDDDGFIWSVSVYQHIGDGAQAKDPALKAFWVIVDVSWSDGSLQLPHTTVLKGLKLAGPP